MRRDRQRIGLIPMGNIADMAPKVIAAHISGYLDLQTILLKAIKSPSYALDKQRLQYDAGPILQRLECQSFKSVDKIIGILDVDLFLPIFTHVFGEARQGGRVALVSIFRLRESCLDTMSDSAIALERAAKIALHELCHLYDLTHCADRHCLMHFSASLSDLDQGSFNLCRYCKRFFEDAILTVP